MVKKNRVHASKFFDFAPISSKQMISPRTVEKPLNILKKRVFFFYMVGREVEIHRGRLDKKIIADRAQLFPRFLSKKIYKNFENFRKNIFIFLDWNFEIFWKISTFFIFEGKTESHFRRIENEKSRDFSRFFKIFQIFHPQKWKYFSNF